MAALCPGVQYGLSSQENFGENKDLVFVKLTDSAYRAIEEYLRLQKQNKHFSRTPTIKFLGNEGQLSFPTSSPTQGGPQPGGGHASASSSSTSSAPTTTTFNFSMSSTAEMEGPGGSFECIQHRQLSSNNPRYATGLAGLGPIPHKMRVHATDDVYEETRKRMTFADKVHKNKCTREIKMNQTDIGRKVKVKQHPNQVHSSSSQSAAPSSSRSGNTGSGGGSTISTGSSNNSSSNSNMRRNDRDSLSTAAAAGSLSSSSAAAAISSSTANSSHNSVANNSQYSPLKQQSSPYSPSLNSNNLNNSVSNNYNSGSYNSGSTNVLLDRISGGGSGSTNGMQQRSSDGQGLRSNHVSSSRPKISFSSIARRPLRERLIHLLALRPFKKIEIHERLNKEGLREKNFSPILKQVATLKGNCYYLNRVVWNDIQEEWPFYSEQDKQMLKRRKPQNLTPPGGSDGGSSTGSGNSPTSTHPGSPPSTTTTLSATAGRHRVAHLSNQQNNNTPQPPPQQLHSTTVGGYTSRPSASTYLDKRQLPVDRRDASGMNPRSRQPQQQGGGGYGGAYAGGGSIKRQLSDDDEADVREDNTSSNSRKRQCDSHTLSFGVNRDVKPWNNHNPSETTIIPPEPTPLTSPIKPSYNHPQSHNRNQQSINSSNTNTFDSLRDSSNYNTTTSQPQRPSPPPPPPPPAPPSSSKEQPLPSTWWTNTNNAKPRTKEVVRVSPDSSQSDRLVEQQRGPQADQQHEYDYQREYTTIRDLEQRRRYKSDFNAVYDEYKVLHGVVEAVSRRFQQLDERLKREPTADTPKYNEIKEQIVCEYKQTKKDQRHQQSKRRFEYLHGKLSHIKRLVSQYDQQIQLSDPSAPAAASSTY